MVFGREHPIRGLYAIVDAGGVVPERDAVAALDQVLEGGARIVQLRAKSLGDRAFLALARTFRERTRSRAAFIVNDRADIACLAEADGVHTGQADLPAAALARWLPDGMHLGVSCHDLEQLRAARAEGLATYAGYGPVYATSTKSNPDPVVGLEGLSAAAREAAGLPLVAIGGITIDRAAWVLAAGASAVAMIGDLFRTADVASRTRSAIEGMVK